VDRYRRHDRGHDPRSSLPRNCEPDGGAYGNGLNAEQLLRETAPIKISVAFVEHDDRERQDLLLRVVNREKNTIADAEVWLTDIRRWDNELGDFVMTAEIYGDGTSFRQLQLGRATLHPNTAVSAGMIRVESNRLVVDGALKDRRRDHHRMFTAGVWQISYEVRGAGERRAQGAVCLTWDGTASIVKPRACPQILFRRDRAPSREHRLRFQFNVPGADARQCLTP
jgi:hypothetical protein